MTAGWFRRYVRFGSRRPRTFRPSGIRLQLELLEERWLPSTVTTLQDGVPGSLRDALNNTPRAAPSISHG